MILNEVSEYAPKKLREMEETFAILKKSSNNKNARLQLLKQVKEFTKIHDVVLFFDNDFNFGVIPKYKEVEFLEIAKSFLNVFSEKKSPLSNKKLIKIKTVEESSEFIDIVYIYIGKPLLKMLTPSELVAVLLHELGHVYSTTTHIPGNLAILFKNILLKPIKSKMFQNDAILSKLLFLYSMVISVLVHGITFTQHAGEHKADNFALKYGYGDDMITALNKFNKIEKLFKKTNPKAKTFLKKIIELFWDVFSITDDEKRMQPHPELKKRIEKLERQMFEEYKKIYPNYKDTFDLIRSNYNEQEAKTK